MPWKEEEARYSSPSGDLAAVGSIGFRELGTRMLGWKLGRGLPEVGMWPSMLIHCCNWFTSNDATACTPACTNQSSQPTRKMVFMPCPFRAQNQQGLGCCDQLFGSGLCRR